MKKTIGIEGMGCGGCVRKVKTVLEGLEGVDCAEVSLDDKNAVVTLSRDLSDEVLKSAVESKGFEVTGIQ